jgi:hypothetical protein
MKITLKQWLAVLAIGVAFAITATFGAGRLKKHVVNLESFIQAPVIQNEGLILPTIDGSIYNNDIYIYHRGSRRLNPITIKHWEKLDGVIKVEETDYRVEITKSPNFEWEIIFHPEHYIPGWEWRKD